MIFVVIVVIVAVAAGAFLRQQSRQSSQPPSEPESHPPFGQIDIPPVEIDDSGEDGYVLTAKPVTSPELASGATYSSHAPAGEESPYGRSSEPKKHAQAAANLLRWCGRSGTIQLDSINVSTPVAYWSNGEPATDEPSCIDVTLPVLFPMPGEQLPAEGAASYAEMSPLQRGIYLTWLSGARIQPPLHMCYPAIWLYGIERRTIVDKLDLPMCISESFRLLPLLRWDALKDKLITFITWLAIKVWLPDEDLLGFCKRLGTVPEGMLDIIMNSYANSMLPLPSAVAFTIARTAEKLRREGDPLLSHSEDDLKTFTPIYKDLCQGGLVLVKPEEMLKIPYVPSNPSIKLSEKESEPVEIPDFFSNLAPFKPLVDAWEVFLTAKKQEEQVPDLADISERPDFEGFIADIKAENGDMPLISTLEALGKLMKFDTSPGTKLTGKERKSVVDTAQVEGWQIVPDLGVSGRNYGWHDRIMFLELAPGSVLSLGYRVASFILEFICASIAADEDRVFEPLRQRLNEFLPMSEDENIRLEAQKPLNLPTQWGPEFYGEFLCSWLSEKERRAVRNLALDAVSLLQGYGGNPEVNSILCEVLGLNESEEIPEKEMKKSPKDKGAEVMKMMALLFKNG